LADDFAQRPRTHAIRERRASLDALLRRRAEQRRARIWLGTPGTRGHGIT
jgi:hypothetical protein